MRKTLTIFNISLLAILGLVLIVPSVYGQGKSGQAPGQAKKENNVVVGNVDQVRGNTIVVDEKKGNKKTETVIDATTQVIGKDKKLLKTNQIKPKDLIAILSSDSSTATAGAKAKKAVKIFVKEASESSTASKRRGVQGMITGINGALITLVHQVHQDRFFNLLTNALTVVKMKGVATAQLSDLQLGMRIAAVGDLDADGTLVARRIHVIPGKGKGLPGFVPPLATPSGTPATPSATPVASPSATPTFTPTPTATESATP